MDRKLLSYRGCLLGFAVGDAMGYAVNDKSWEEIAENYGPNGLLGYDLCNDGAQITSYTQIAAYMANALLASLSRGKRDTYLQYSAAALREWAKRQHFPRDPEPSVFWVARMPQLRRRCCKDSRLLGILRTKTLGTVDAPTNASDAPGALSYGMAVGLYYAPERIGAEQIGALAAELTAMTHGGEQAFLSAAVLAYGVAGILQQPEIPLRQQFTQALSVVRALFGNRFDVDCVEEPINLAFALAQTPGEDPRADMERLSCTDAPHCLAGALYASLVFGNNFDEALICAVNHSGASCAVGALTGALLGAYMGADALPEFYLESLDCTAALSELAQDLARGSMTSSLFDTDWDQKYIQGQPLQDTEE